MIKTNTKEKEQKQNHETMEIPGGFTGITKQKTNKQILCKIQQINLVTSLTQ